MTGTQNSEATEPTATEPKLIGTPGSADAVKTYTTLMAEARKHRFAEEAKINEAIETIRRSIATITDDRYDERVVSLISITRQLLDPEHITARTRDQERYVSAVAEAKAALTEATDADKFVVWLHTRARRMYDDEYVDAVLDVLHASIEDINNLAYRNAWCTDYERAMEYATERGLLNTGTITITRQVRGCDLPHDIRLTDGSHPTLDDRYEVTMELPAYVRTDHNDSTGHSVYYLHQRALTTTIRQLGV